MAQFNSKNSFPIIGSQALLIIFLVISLICMFAYSGEDENGPLHGMQASVNGLVSPAKTVGGAIGSLENGLETSLEDLTVDADTLTELKKQNAELREMVSSLEEARQENERLKELQKISDTYKLQTMTCRVIGVSSDAWNRTITIDKGSNDGVEAGMPVMGASGIVGQIQNASKGTSTVRLLQDPNSGCGVRIQSNRAEGVITGSLEGLLYLKDVAGDVKVQVGDVIVTSGLGGSYYKGLLVGTVVRVDEGADATERTIIVSPNSTVAVMEEVMVVFSVGKTNKNSNGTTN